MIALNVYTLFTYIFLDNIAADKGYNFQKLFRTLLS